MNWSVSEAKAKLSEVLARARRSPQVIESRGEEVAVVLSKHEFDQLQQLRAKPRATPIAELLDFTERLKAGGDLELVIPPREIEPDRPILFADDD